MQKVENLFQQVDSSIRTIFNKLSFSQWAGLIMLIGVFLRTRQYLYNRSLWLDELMLGINIVEKDFTQLLGVLEYEQMAPIGYLMFSKASVLLFGTGELALRFIPMIAGLGSIFFVYKMLKESGNKLIILLGIFLFVFSFRQSYYSSEVKQYSWDVLAVALAYAYYLPKNYLNGNYGRILLTALLGAFVIWFSHTVIFILLGLGLYHSILLLKEWDFTKALKLCLVGIIWVTSFLVHYVGFISKDPSIEGKQDVFRKEMAFAPFPPSSLGDISWYNTSINDLFEYSTGIIYAGSFLLIILIIGVFYWAYMKKDLIWLPLLFPIVFVYLAAIIELYPFAGRLWLFLAPPVIFLVCSGCQAIKETSQKRFIPTLIIISLVVPPILLSFLFLVKPQEEEEVKQVLAVFKEQYQEGDILFYSYNSSPVIRYYKNDFIPETTEVMMSSYEKVGDYYDRDDLSKFDRDIRELDQLGGRVWMLFSHDFWGEEEYIVSKAKDKATLEGEKQAKNASIYLFNFDE